MIPYDIMLIVLFAILIVMQVLVIITSVLQSKNKKEVPKGYDWINRKAFIQSAARWHGYIPPRVRMVKEISKTLSDPCFSIFEDIPKALHAQHRIAGEEKRLGRKMR